MSLYKLYISVHHLIYTSTHHFLLLYTNLTVHQSSSLYSILPHFTPVYFNLNHGTFFTPLHLTLQNSNSLYCHRRYNVFVTDNLRLSQKVCFCHGESVFSKIVCKICICHRKFLCVCLYLYQTLFLIIFGLIFLHDLHDFKS